MGRKGYRRIPTLHLCGHNPTPNERNYRNETFI